MNEIINKIRKNPLLRNKYFLVSVFFIIWISFLDANNLVKKIHDSKKLKGLKKDKNFYQQKIAEDSVRLNDLLNNKKNIEKYAREKLYMKKENEDVFVFKEKND